MSRNRGMPRLAGGILARERAIWAGQCALPSCESGAPVAGVIEFASGPSGFCAACCDRAEQDHGYRVRREPMDGVQVATDAMKES